MDEAGRPVDSKPIGNAPSVGKFVSPGILLFIDQLLIAAGGWVYWLTISRFASTSEIGHATTVYSLILLFNTIIQLGMEYPLLKRATVHRTQIFGTAIAIEMILTAISIPIILYIASNLYEDSYYLVWTAIGILVFSSATFVARFALLGLSNAKLILIFDVIGSVVKFVGGFTLISMGYGSLGILLSFLFQAAIVAVGILYFSKQLFEWSLGGMKFAKEIIKDSLVNTPSKLSSMLVTSLSIVLLASFGVDSSEVGVFYIALVVSIVVGSFASSLAFMSIPASSESNSDLSTGSLRIGMSFTAPIITVLIAVPNTVLSVIGSGYASAEEILPILALGILPSVIISNAISKFNNLNKPKKILSIGCTRVVVFLLMFFILVPQYGTLGAAYSILFSFITTTILALTWSERILLRYTVIAILAILSGIAVGKIVDIMFNYAIATILSSLLLTFGFIIALKVTSVKEITTIMKIIKIR